jgi:predicted TIM-barrel fold metal-dependent hydrolase
MPMELYAERLPIHLRDRAPRIETKEKREFVVSGDTVTRELPKGGGARPGEWEPGGRHSALAEDGVAAEVIYGGGVGRIRDNELAVACARVYNDWLVELFGARRDRFAAAALMPIRDIDASIRELERVAKLGLRPVVLPDHMDERPYNSPDYDPFWAAAQALNMPLSFHVGGSSGGRDNIKVRGLGGAITNYALSTSSIIETLSHLASGGVLERFPDLRVTLVECGIGWVAWAMHILDEGHLKHAHWARPKLAEPPSFYIKRQLTFTFMDDPVGVADRLFTGANMLMWGSDYPHYEGTWPHSREALARQFAGVPEAETRQIISENAKRLYGFSID